MKKIDKQKIGSFCKDHGIRKLSLFGSVITDNFGSESDVDVLVEFYDGKTPGLIAFSGVVLELSEKFFEGRRVDLLTKPMLKGELGKIILDSSEVIYEEAA